MNFGKAGSWRSAYNISVWRGIGEGGEKGGIGTSRTGSPNLRNKLKSFMGLVYCGFARRGSGPVQLVWDLEWGWGVNFGKGGIVAKRVQHKRVEGNWGRRGKRRDRNVKTRVPKSPE